MYVYIYGTTFRTYIQEEALYVRLVLWVVVLTDYFDLAGLYR